MSTNKHPYIIFPTVAVSWRMWIFSWGQHTSQGSQPGICLLSILPHMTGRMRVSLQDRSRDNTLLEHQPRRRETTLSHEYADTLIRNNCLQWCLLQAIRTPIHCQRIMLLGWPSCSHMLWWIWDWINTVSESSSNQSAWQHKEWHYWVVKSHFCTTDSETNWGNLIWKQRKIKGEIASVWEITYFLFQLDYSEVVSQFCKVWARS